jgi:hypothetical protein
MQNEWCCRSSSGRMPSGSTNHSATSRTRTRDSRRLRGGAAFGNGRRALVAVQPDSGQTHGRLGAENAAPPVGATGDVELDRAARARRKPRPRDATPGFLPRQTTRNLRRWPNRGGGLRSWSSRSSAVGHRHRRAARLVDVDVRRPRADADHSAPGGGSVFGSVARAAHAPAADGYDPVMGFSHEIVDLNCGEASGEIQSLSPGESVKRVDEGVIPDQHQAVVRRRHVAPR